jgi:hypothetical protein
MHTRQSERRYAHEALFSINAGMIIKLFRNLTLGRSSIGAADVRLEQNLQWGINTHIHRFPQSSVGGYAAFTLLALIAAGTIFVVLRLFSLIRLEDRFLRLCAGLLSAILLPTCWLYVSALNPPPRGLPSPPLVLLAFELGCIVSWILLYLRYKPGPNWFNIALLALHFVFWGWLLLGGPFFWRDPFKCIFPAMGFASVFAWSLYVKASTAGVYEVSGEARAT